jgi:hypothetical protein
MYHFCTSDQIPETGQVFDVGFRLSIHAKEEHWGSGCRRLRLVLRSLIVAGVCDIVGVLWKREGQGRK